MNTDKHGYKNELRHLLWMVVYMWALGIGYYCRGANINFDLINIISNPGASRKIQLNPQSTPRTNSLGQVVMSERYSFTNGTNGTYLLSNVVDGVYETRVFGTNGLGDSIFNILVPADTNTYSLSALLTSQVVPPSTVSYTRTQSDVRYVLKSSGSASDLTVSNITLTGTLNGTNFTNSVEGMFLAGANVTFTKDTNTGKVTIASSGGGGSATNGLLTLNGINATNQTFSISSNGVVPLFSSTGTNHTLVLPEANTNRTGVLRSNDFASFQGKLESTNPVAVQALSVTNNSGAVDVYLRPASGNPATYHYYDGGSQKFQMVSSANTFKLRDFVSSADVWSYSHSDNALTLAVDMLAGYGVYGTGLQTPYIRLSGTGTNPPAIWMVDPTFGNGSWQTYISGEGMNWMVYDSPGTSFYNWFQAVKTGSKVASVVFQTTNSFIINAPDIWFPNGAANGYVWTSDADGHGTWQPAPGTPQTPWTSDINGGGFTATNINNLAVTNQLSIGPFNTEGGADQVVNITGGVKPGTSGYQSYMYITGGASAGEDGVTVKAHNFYASGGVVAGSAFDCSAFWFGLNVINTDTAIDPTDAETVYYIDATDGPINLTIPSGYNGTRNNPVSGQIESLLMKFVRVDLTTNLVTIEADQGDGPCLIKGKMALMLAADTACELMSDHTNWWNSADAFPAGNVNDIFAVDSFGNRITKSLTATAPITVTHSDTNILIANPYFIIGNANPNSAVTAPKGALFSDTNNGALYYHTNTGNTGWVLK